jgi:hypothetical protein
MAITQSNKDLVLPKVMSVLFMCGWCLIHFCYAHIIVLLGNYLCCTLHAIFVIICDSLCIRKYVPYPERYAEGLYNSTFFSLNV